MASISSTFICARRRKDCILAFLQGEEDDRRIIIIKDSTTGQKKISKMYASKIIETWIFKKNPVRIPFAHAADCRVQIKEYCLCREDQANIGLHGSTLEAYLRLNWEPANRSTFYHWNPLNGFKRLWCRSGVSAGLAPLTRRLLRNECSFIASLVKNGIWLWRFL